MSGDELNSKTVRPRYLKQLMSVGFTLLSLFSAVNVAAGKPYEYTAKCPVGGHEYSVTGTYSCSVMARTMSQRPITTCDFRTRLPVCPVNGLPVYRKFNEGNKLRLEEIIQSEEYVKLRLLPKWQRAYELSVLLGDDDRKKALGLLLSAWWYETDSFVKNEPLVERLAVEIDFKLDVDPEYGDDARYNAMLAFLYSYAGKPEAAARRMKMAHKGVPFSDCGYTYLEKVEECLNKASHQDCRPRTFIGCR